MAEYLIQGETLTELGDKIRVLNGSEGTMLPSEMISKLQDINDGLDEISELIDNISSNSTMTSIVLRTISGSYTNDVVTIIGGSAFRGCTLLTSVYFPNVTSIGAGAFNGCTNLTVYTPAGSFVEQFMKKNKIRYVAL